MQPKAASLDALPIGNSDSITASSPLPFTAYRAGYWAASEWQGDEIKLAAGTTSGPVSQVSFSPPPAGDWMLAAHLTFATGDTAVYYWHVTVP